MPAMASESTPPPPDEFDPPESVVESWVEPPPAPVPPPPAVPATVLPLLRSVNATVAHEDDEADSIGEAIDAEVLPSKPKRGKHKAPPTAWRQGQSGNPGGLSKEDRALILEVRRMALVRTPAMVRTLTRIALDDRKSVFARIMAAQAVAKLAGMESKLVDAAEQQSPEGVANESRRAIIASLARSALPPGNDRPTPVESDTATVGSSGEGLERMGQD